MKRIAALSVAVVAVALVVPALAATTTRRTYFGPAGTGANNAGVEISARLTDGDPSKLTKFEWHNVLQSGCGGRSGGATTDEFPKAIKVDSGEFDATGKLDAGHVTVKVKGKFKSQNKQMKGTLRVRSTSGACTNDTGTVSWTAKQPARQK